MKNAVATPATPALSAPPQAMVADQLDALLGEHLMPLRARTPGRDEPYLLAVDASGQPVVVEVVAVLDEAAVLAALRHAGQAARMSTRDLAEAYSGGANRFASHLAAFRLTVPSTALLSTFVRGGARLLLVCSHVSPGVAEVLEFLLQPGWQVDVLRAQVVNEPGGQRVVELSPVARPAPPERSVELPPWAPAERVDPLFDPTPVFRSTPVPRYTSRPNQPAQMSRPTPAPAAPAVAATPAPASAPVRPAPVVVPPPFAVPMARLEAVDPVLAALGEVLDGPVALVWSPDRGECFEALLRADGYIELADGSSFGDVETATRVISGIDGPLDAWQVWHVDSPTGPTLADLAEAAFPGQF